jgi:quercetin dioxygenase-like cupin family protein
MNVWTIRMGALLVGLCAAVAVSGPPTARAAEAGPVITFDPQVAKFAPVPIMPSCATVAPVRGNPRNGLSVVIVKLAAGCRVPWHWHTPNEDVIVVSGTVVLEMKDGKPLQFREGAYASMPSHHVHQARCSRICAFFSISDDTFDIHYVDDAGNEIPMDEALKKQAARKAKKKHPF